MPAHVRSPDCAESGVGTLIVFIAATLATVGVAGALADQHMNLNEGAAATGESSKSAASGLLRPLAAGGHVSGATIDRVLLAVSVSQGMAHVDLSTLVLTHVGPSALTEAVHRTSDDPSTSSDDSALVAGEYGLAWIVDVQGRITSSATPVAIGGDVVVISYVPGGTIAPGDTWDLTVRPSKGPWIDLDLYAPTSFAGHEFVPLR